MSTLTRPMRAMNHAAFSLTVLALAAALSGCATRPHDQASRPVLQTPAAWQQVSADKANMATLSPWWSVMGDPLLVKLIDQALAANNNLAQATLKVHRAQLVAGQAESNQLPGFALQANGSANQLVSGQSTTTKRYAVVASVSWEADLWGRVAGLRQAADWEAEATEQDRQATALVLVGTTANLYWQIAYLNQRVLASQASIEYARQTLQLVQAQVRAGIASGLEESQAVQAVATQEAAHTQWLQQRVVARNALAILFDGPPGVAISEAQIMPEGGLPDVPAGLPASLLVRRPDLRAAELRLREALSNVNTTRASYYPTLTLTGSLGTASTTLAKVLSDPLGTLGAGLILPFVQWRDMERNVAISRTDYEVAVRGYRQSWYQALGDVENALSARGQYENQGIKLAQALDAARQAEHFSEVRYRGGTVALKIWLDAQEARRTAENNLAQNRLNRLGALVTLYQALGGGVSADASS